MEQLAQLWAGAMQYPCNFASRKTLRYRLDQYFDQLNEHHGRLFSPEDHAAVTFRDLVKNGNGELYSLRVGPASATIELN